MMGLLLRVLVVVLAILLVRWLLRGDSWAASKRVPAMGTGRDVDELVALCKGDPQRALSLMADERLGDPNIDEQEACRRAIERFRSTRR